LEIDDKKGNVRYLSMTYRFGKVRAPVPENDRENEIGRATGKDQGFFRRHNMKLTKGEI
jgi:hypothetical protein